MTDYPGLRPLLVPCALVGGFALLVTFTKDLQNLWPLQPGLPNWRFGAMGFLLGTGALPVLGLTLMALVAGVGQSPRLARMVSVLGLALGLVFLVGLAVFLVDSRQVIQQAGGGDAGAMVAGATRRTVVFGMFTAPAYLALGWASHRMAGKLAAMTKVDRQGLVVGSSAP